MAFFKGAVEVARNLPSLWREQQVPRQTRLQEKVNQFVASRNNPQNITEPISRLHDLFSGKTSGSYNGLSLTDAFVTSELGSMIYVMETPTFRDKRDSFARRGRGNQEDIGYGKIGASYSVTGRVEPGNIHISTHDLREKGMPVHKDLPQWQVIDLDTFTAVESERAYPTEVKVARLVNAYAPKADVDTPLEPWGEGYKAFILDLSPAFIVQANPDETFKTVHFDAFGKAGDPVEATKEEIAFARQQERMPQEAVEALLKQVRQDQNPPTIKVPNVF